MRIVIFLGMSLALAFVASGIMARANTLLFIGSTAAPVVSPVNGATISEWSINGGEVGSTKVSFGSPLDAGSRVCVQVTGPAGGLANGCEILAASWAVGDAPIPINFGAGVPPEFGPGLGSSALVADITGVDVTVLGPVAVDLTGSGAFPIEIVDVGWVLLGTDTSLVRRVNVVFAPYGEVVSTCGVDLICDFRVFLGLQNSSGINLAQCDTEVTLDPGVNVTLDWDLTTQGTPGPSGPVSAEAITRFLVSFVPKDPWDSDYIYVSPGQHKAHKFDLQSNGPDQSSDTEDDIVNW